MSVRLLRDPRCGVDFFEALVQRVVDQAQTVRQFRRVGREQDFAAVADQIRRELVDVPHDVRRAVVGDRVVELGFAGEFVCPLHHADEHPLRLFGRGFDAVNEDLVPAQVRAQVDEIAFVADDIHQLVLVEEALERVERLV